jgi:glutamate---cysteine ligase / carboxylate-amine ligase
MPIKRPSLTIGIEEEYQIIDPATGELKSFITELLKHDRIILKQIDIKPELHQSIAEIGTKPCETIQDARKDLSKLRGMVGEMVRDQGAAIAAAGTHPFSSWQRVAITPFERYQGIINDMQDVARQLLIFGMHVHVGIEEPEFAIDTMNTIKYMLPHVLALSTSSPFWEGRNTGLKSYRSAMFRFLHRTGIPPYLDSYAEYSKLVDALIATRSIESSSKIYWDIRPHHAYPTLEFRICDLCTSLDDAICCAAIFQALVLKHYKMRLDNIRFRKYPNAVIEENKWRAVRYGVQGKLVDWGKETEFTAKELISELLEFIDDVIDDLGTRKEIEHAYTILERGTSADRQLKVFEETNDMREVVNWLIEETARGTALEG